MTDHFERIDLYLEGDLPDEQAKELEAWLCASEENSDAFVRYVLLHRQSFEIYEERRLAEQVSGPDEPTRIGDWLQKRIVDHPVRSTLAWSAVIAASVVFMLWGGGMLKQPGAREVASADSQAALQQPEQAAEAEIAATLTGAVDCQWKEGFDLPSYGQNLEVGATLALERGITQVTFESGAKCVLSGPCVFRIDSRIKGTLDRGKVAAVIPRSATGFIVRTPCAEIIDLGTEFGVDVDEQGLSEVHVFKGEVVSRHVDQNGVPSDLEVRLFENEAAEFQPGIDEARQFPASDSRFVRDIAPRLTESDLPRAPQLPRLALWFAADLLVKTDQENRVIAWEDVLCGDNQSADDALQSNDFARPMLVEDAINGCPVVRFNGETSYLVSTPMENTDDQTLFFVVSSASWANSRRRSGIQPGHMINYNGPPHRNLESAAGGTPGVLQIGPQPAQEGGLKYTAFVYHGIAAGGGLKSRGGIPFGQPVVGAYVYDTSQNQARLYLNGALEEETSAPTPAAVVSRKVFGRHGHIPAYYSGDIAEVLIYNKALNPKEVARVNRYLLEKYGIDAAK